jgi:raffinose/stachyose/melibiose transport system substrate-binding protein
MKVIQRIGGIHVATKKIFTCCTLLLLSLAVLGCSTSGGDSKPVAKIGEESTAAGKPKAKAPVKFVVWGSGNAENLRIIQDAFNEKYDDVDLTIEMQGGSYWDYMGAKTASNDLPDLFYLSAFEKVSTYAKNGMIVDVSSRPVASKLYKDMRAPVSYENKIYGYPFGMSFLGVLYNKDLFAKAGITEPPKTITEFKQVVQKLKDAKITPWTSALKTSFTGGHLFSAALGSALNFKHEDWIKQMNSGSGTFKFNGSDGIFQAIDVIKGNMNSNPLDSDVNNGNKLFATGETAMYHNGNWTVNDVKKLNPNINLGLFPFPVSEDPQASILAVDAEGVVVVNKNSKVVEAALKVFDRLTDPSDPKGYVAIMAGGGVTPPMETPYTVKLNGAEIDFKKYVQEGKTAPWIFQQFPSTTIWEQAKQTVPGYFADAKSKDDVNKEMDQAWKKAVQK